MAISRLRARPRASNRFARFEQAMIRTNPTSPISILMSASNCGDLLDPPLQLCAHRRAPVAIRLRILALEVCPESRKFGLRRLPRISVPQAAFHDQIGPLAVVQRIRRRCHQALRHPQRNENRGANEAVKPGERLREHADDREGDPVEPAGCCRSPAALPSIRRQKS